MILDNKSDLEGYIGKNKIIKKLDLNRIINSDRAEVFETSAKTGEGIAPAFEWLANQILEALK